MSEYLNAQDLHALTGYAQLQKQALWLTQNGVPHRKIDSRVIVSHRHVTSWIEGRTVVRSNGLNLAGIK